MLSKADLKEMATDGHKLEREAAVEIQDLRTKCSRIHEDMLCDAEALAILASTELGFDKNGEIPQKSNRHSAVFWALQQAQYRHAWVVCGPVNNAMERLMKKREIDDAR